MNHSTYRSYSLSQLYTALDTLTEAEQPGLRKRIEARIRELESKEVPSEGIRGWLYVMGIGLVLSSVRLGRIIYGTYFDLFADGAWQAITTPGAVGYDRLGARFLMTEMTLLLVLMAADIVLAVLFFTRRRIFPKWFIRVSVVGLVLIAGDVWIIRPLLPQLPAALSPLMTREMIIGVVRCLIGVTYMVRSERVRRTFTR